MKILVLEDNEDNATLIEKSLRDYEVCNAQTLQEAREMIDGEHFDLFLIDVNLPDGSGFDFCSELSMTPKFEETPKIILSGLKETKDKVYGFQCGAEDYLSKPFAVEELRARVRARLRKKTTQKQVLLRIDSILFDFQFQKAQFVEGEESTDLALTPTEFKILYRIMNRKGNLCSRQDLVRDIWKKNGLFIEKSGVDSHISHLRKKLSPFPIKIHSIYNQGFLYS